MSPLVRRFLKTAIGFLILGIALGVCMLIRRELQGAWPSPWWISAHTHAILVGFVILVRPSPSVRWSGGRTRSAAR